jgi:hypothetical protein
MSEHEGLDGARAVKAHMGEDSLKPHTQPIHVELAFVDSQEPCLHRSKFAQLSFL